MKYYDRKINYYETDQMGIVHHSNYIRYFEEARCSFMEQSGYPYARLEEEEILSPTLAVSCKCAFHYEITDAETRELRAKGTSEHGFIGRDGKPVNLPKEKPDFYAVCQSEYEPEEQ